MNELKLFSVYELLEKNYFIPSYQRGYRWGTRQIQDLLDDLFTFAMDVKDEKSFYCLQPIILKSCDDNTVKDNKLESELDSNKWYEVVDGQQRLTTLYIVFKYLMNNGINLKDDYNRELYKIVYQTEKHRSTKYIENPDELNDSTPNSYFITHGYKDVETWFSNLPNKYDNVKKKDAKDALISCLTSREKDKKKPYGYVQIIWYELPKDQDPIKTFTRVNIGKIPLTNSELIKALFLQKRGLEEVANIQQIQIAKEWDLIENALQDKSVWAFLNKENQDMPAHIDFLFNLIGEIEKSKNSNEYEALYGKDNFATFRFFNDAFIKADYNKIKETWNAVLEYYETFMEWYSDFEWYHYIGFLIYCDTPIIKIYKMYENCAKNEFKDKLINEIRANFKSIKIEKNKIAVSYDNKTKQEIRKLLLIYNIEFIVNKKSDYIRFPFDKFKTESWDIEHIDSFTTNPLKDNEEQKEWVRVALKDLDGNGIKKTLEEEEAIDEFLNNKNTASKFDNVRDIISQLAGEFIPTKETSEDLKNSIGNLTLLNSDINRGYGNAIFPTKRNAIIESDGEGKFIPICTKNVFLKYFTKEASSNVCWGKDDMEKYHKNIIDVIGKYLGE